MRGYLNKASLAVGTGLGAAGNSVASSNISDAVTEMLPLIIELAIVVVLLGMMLKLFKQIKM